MNLHIQCLHCLRSLPHKATIFSTFLPAFCTTHTHDGTLRLSVIINNNNYFRSFRINITITIVGRQDTMLYEYIRWQGSGGGGGGVRRGFKAIYTNEKSVEKFCYLYLIFIFHFYSSLAPTLAHSSFHNRRSSVRITITATFDTIVCIDVQCEIGFVLDYFREFAHRNGVWLSVVLFSPIFFLSLQFGQKIPRKDCDTLRDSQFLAHATRLCNKF